MLTRAAGGKHAIERVVTDVWYRFEGAKFCLSPGAAGGGGVKRTHGEYVSGLVRAARASSPKSLEELRKQRAAAAAVGALVASGGASFAADAVNSGIWARAVESDPFWAPHPVPNVASAPGVVMSPTRLGAKGVASRPFILSNAQAMLLRGKDSRSYQLQLQCVMNDDEVPARQHWPFLANVRVNDTPLPVMFRQPGSAMGKAGRDPPVSVPLGVAVEGRNVLSVSCADSRMFTVLMRIVKRRRAEEVKARSIRWSPYDPVRVVNADP